MSLRIGLTLGVLLAASAAAFAEGATTIVIPSGPGGHKRGPVRVQHAPPSDAERAARLAEGRKKFFDEVQGFDNDIAPPGIAAAPSPADLWPSHIGPRVRR